MINLALIYLFIFVSLGELGVKLLLTFQPISRNLGGHVLWGRDIINLMLT